ncbi:hypothetical protein BKP45_14085 [Anaerobacillus alkalidiazotrophicus]|uniref:Uncharacterized protein n=1 Tax=Anaerobacillus alkalidiazotrophicus TaxID=472963 RepID=A0A1S2M3F1_9BACI|nr:hypothetical protein [Anaerobacillus alkalidiazotrophicus]OIJ19279.1 hypothetical protein BKP45_14085 [Anaerobacillus alkalidiazotrophicus]
MGRSLEQKRKRLKRKQRLKDAKKNWLTQTITSKNILPSYCQWYGVDKLCALIELEMLGHSFSEEYKQNIMKEIEEKRSQKKKHVKENINHIWRMILIQTKCLPLS